MKVCIACQADVGGKPAVPIKEDRIIRFIRTAKRALGVAQMNELYVCEADIPKHIERRKGFEKTMLFASIFAGLVAVLLLYSIIASARFDAWAITSAFVVALFILALPLFRYTPAIESNAVLRPEPLPPAMRPAQEKKPRKKARKAPKTRKKK